MNEPIDDLPPATPAPSGRQVVLGLFILFQLAFLVVSNATGYLRYGVQRWPEPVVKGVDRVAPGLSKDSGHTYDMIDVLYRDSRRWAQLTGQHQSWSLFAPGVGDYSGFPAVVFAWEDDAPVAAADPLKHAAPMLTRLAADGPVQAAVLEFACQQQEAWTPPPGSELFLSDNEPADLDSFLRVGNFRFRRVEGLVIPFLRPRSDETQAETLERWTQDTRSHVRENAAFMFGYLRVRRADYQARHPERPAPRQVILLERNWQLRPSGSEDGPYSRPYTLPLVRWRPSQQPAREGTVPLDWYNHSTRRFVSLATNE